jgi:hypothetical protein
MAMSSTRIASVSLRLLSFWIMPIGLRAMRGPMGLSYGPE